MRAVWLFGLSAFLICFHHPCFADPDRYDVVIDEIMADPVPTVALPSSEYIELRNVSAVAHDLYKWKITDGSSTATISTHFTLMPDALVVVCSTSAAAAFSVYGNTIGVNNFPSLNNDEDVISVLSAEGKLIHAVHYHVSWYNNAVKSDGGWSLEMVDVHNPCSGAENWKVSTDPSGGTPGRKNSVDGIQTDNHPPSLKRCYVKDSNIVVALFDEPLDSNEAVDPRHYVVDHAIGSPQRIIALPPMFEEISLQFSKALEHHVAYKLTVNGVTDCSHNTIGQMNTASVGIPEDADTMDIVINEILFNPKPGGFDYIELFNRSDKIIDASHLYLANRSLSGTVGAVKQLINSSFLVFPGDYIVVTEDAKRLQADYLVNNPSWIIQIALPSFPDDEGDAIVMNQQGKLIDELKYEEKWQFPLIRNAQGVALERIDAFEPTQQPTNWTSAAFTAGFGTPTYQNSQSLIKRTVSGGITISPATFSPDNDGYNDFCFIYYEMNQPNCVANIWIYDFNGTLVRILYNNITLSQKGYLIWNGLGENNRLLPPGLYVVYTSVFNLQGKTKAFRSVVSLARRY